MFKIYKNFRDCTIVSAILFVLIMIYMFPYPLKLWDSLPNYQTVNVHLTSIFYSAKSLLSGKLFPDFNTRFYYPYGNTLAWNDCHIFLSAIFTPFYIVTKNPVFSFNITVLLFWVFSGFGMYYFLTKLFKNKYAAFFGAFAFVLCPFRTSYFNVNNMQLLYGIPFAFGFLIEFFKTRRYKYLLYLTFIIILQSYSSWYYTIILIIALLLFIFISICVRAYNYNTLDIFLGLVLALLIGYCMHFLVNPYVENNSELGMYKSLEEMEKNSADITSYAAIKTVENTNCTSYVHLNSTIASLSENIISPGYTIYGLALIMLIFSFLRKKQIKLPKYICFIDWIITFIIFFTIGVIITFLIFKKIEFNYSFFHFTLTKITKPIIILITFILFKMILKTQNYNKNIYIKPIFNLRKFTIIISYLGLIFFIFSLGPTIKFFGENFGHGLIYYLYDFMFPIKATKVLSRFSVIVIFSCITLASLLIAYVSCLMRKNKFLLFIFYCLIYLVAGAEFIYGPYSFNSNDFQNISETYKYLDSRNNEFAILEIPSNNEYYNSEYMYWTNFHSKYLLNGFSGFKSSILNDVSTDLYFRLFPDFKQIPNEDLNSDKYFTVYPLKYLVVHLSKMSEDLKKAWLNIYRNPPQFLRFDKTFNDDIIFEFIELPIDLPTHKTFSYNFIKDKPYINITIDCPNRTDIEKIILDLKVFDKPNEQIPLTPGKQLALNFILKASPYHIKLNSIYMNYEYKLKPASTINKPEYKLGLSDVYLPCDVQITSTNKDYGDESSIMINGLEYSKNLRGLNIVSLSQDGEIIESDNFDPVKNKFENIRLINFINKLNPGTIVIASVKDDLSSFDDKATETLKKCGFITSFKNKFKFSYIGVGYIGAAPANVIEKTSKDRLNLQIGIKNPPKLVHFECSSKA